GSREGTAEEICRRRPTVSTRLSRVRLLAWRSGTESKEGPALPRMFAAVRSEGSKRFRPQILPAWEKENRETPSKGRVWGAAHCQASPWRLRLRASKAAGWNRPPRDRSRVQP